MSTETVLIYREDGHDTFREWVAPNDKVRMVPEGPWITVYSAYIHGEADTYEGTLHVAFRNVVEAHLVTRAKKPGKDQYGNPLQPD
jgi:hypothetical protein